MDYVNVMDIFCSVDARIEQVRSELAQYEEEAIASATATMCKCYKEHPDSLYGMALVLQLLRG